MIITDLVNFYLRINHDIQALFMPTESVVRKLDAIVCYLSAQRCNEISQFGEGN